MKKLSYLLLIVLMVSCSRSIESPTVLRNFSEPASSGEIILFAKEVSENSDFLEYRIFGESAEGKELIMLRNTVKKNTVPLRVLIFAQQHGNEQSGKEAVLLLARDFSNKMHRKWLRDMEIWLVPQVNPDGGDRNERRNGMGLDLNRDHLVRQAPETMALHALFREFMPHVTIDIHEYQPFRPSWEEFGGFKTFDVQVGVPTNLNVPEKIRDFAQSEALPAIESHLTQKGFSFHNYLVGPVPTEGRTRHSTVDIDDGRQSFAILGSLSFIFEGINGRDGFIESLDRRTYGQYEALKALLGFLHENRTRVIQIVEESRQNLISSQPGDYVSIQMEHFPDGNPLVLPLLSSRTGRDTTVIVDNYHPVVKSIIDVTRPSGYLVPSDDSLLVSFLQTHRIQFQPYQPSADDIITAYFPDTSGTITLEELDNSLPQVKIVSVLPENLKKEFLLVTTAQLHANFLVTVLEPQSSLGLAQRDGYQYLLKYKQKFPVLRLE